MPRRGGAGVVLGTHLMERGDLTRRKVVETMPDCDERGPVGEDLGRHLERPVLVDRDQERSWPATPGDGDVLPSIGHLVEQLGEVGPELTDRYGLRHGPGVPHGAHESDGICGSSSTAVRSLVVGGPLAERAAARSTLVTGVPVTVLDPSAELRLHRLTGAFLAGNRDIITCASFLRQLHRWFPWWTAYRPDQHRLPRISVLASFARSLVQTGLADTTPSPRFAGRHVPGPPDRPG